MIKKLWFKLFPKKASKLKYSEIGNALHVKEISEEGECLHEGLGMTVKRCDELNEICHKAFMSEENIIASMEVISKECKHANELFFCSYMIVKSHLRNNEDADPILALLKNIMRRKRP